MNNINLVRAIRRFGRLLNVVLAVSVLSACLVPGEVAQSEYTARGLMGDDKVHSHYVAVNGARLHYMTRGAGSEALVIFIHGTPGSWSIFSSQLADSRLSKQAVLVAPDRPGWGGSMAAYSGDDSLEGQSKQLIPFITALKNEYKAKHLVLVGHSLGASLVARIAMDAPELIDAIVVLAGDLSDQVSAAHWYNALASWKLVSWAVPDALKKANKEVLQLDSSLAAMKPMWRNLSVPLLVVQGLNDELVHPRHADFAEGLTTRSEVRVVKIKNAGHLLLISHAEQINQLLLEVIEKSEA
jgi:pimeloyl-ACP methyl ester carboxylesterase